MNQQELYAASLERDRRVERAQMWLNAGAWLFVPVMIGLLIAIPAGYLSEARAQSMAPVIVVLLIAWILVMVFGILIIRKGANVALGLHCPKCGVALEKNYLLAVACTDSCGKCGTRLVDDAA